MSNTLTAQQLLGGKLVDSVTFPASGMYRAVIDVYPAAGSQPNFQLFGKVRVAGAYRTATRERQPPAQPR